MLAGVRGWGHRMSQRKEGWREKSLYSTGNTVREEGDLSRSSTGDETRGGRGELVGEVEIQLGACSGGRSEDPVRCLLPWPLRSQDSTVIPKIAKLHSGIRKLFS